MLVASTRRGPSEDGIGAATGWRLSQRHRNTRTTRTSAQRQKDSYVRRVPLDRRPSTRPRMPTTWRLTGAQAALAEKAARACTSGSTAADRWWRRWSCTGSRSTSGASRLSEKSPRKTRGSARDLGRCGSSYHRSPAQLGEVLFPSSVQGKAQGQAGSTPPTRRSSRPRQPGARSLGCARWRQRSSAQQGHRSAAGGDKPATGACTPDTRWSEATGRGPQPIKTGRTITTARHRTSIREAFVPDRA